VAEAAAKKEPTPRGEPEAVATSAAAPRLPGSGGVLREEGRAGEEAAGPALRNIGRTCKPPLAKAGAAIEAGKRTANPITRV